MSQIGHTGQNGQTVKWMGKITIDDKMQFTVYAQLLKLRQLTGSRKPWEKSSLYSKLF